MPFVVTFSCGTTRCQTRPTSEPSRRQMLEKAEMEESDRSTIGCWECGCVHTLMRKSFCDRGMNVEIPVRAPLCGEETSVVIPSGGGVILLHNFGLWEESGVHIENRNTGRTCCRYPERPQTTGASNLEPSRCTMTDLPIRPCVVQLDSFTLLH